MKARLSLAIFSLVLSVVSFALNADCGRRCRVRQCRECPCPRRVCKPEPDVVEAPVRIKRVRPRRGRAMIFRKNRQAAINAYLFESVKEGHLAEVQLALTERAQVNARDRLQRIPLHYAIGDYHPRRVTALDKIAVYLIDNGADLYAPDNEGIMPLDLMQKKNNLRLIGYLQKRGLVS